MLWRKRDMGSDPVYPIFVTTDIPTVPDPLYQYERREAVEVPIPIDAYKRLTDWASIGRTIDNLFRVMNGEGEKSIAVEELEKLRPALLSIHNAVRQHYISLPIKTIDQPRKPT